MYNAACALPHRNRPMQTETLQTLIDDLLRDISRDDFALPTLPNVATKIRELMADPNVSADRIVAVLSGDPFVSAQIIRSANSAAFAGMPPISNVRDATLRLGYRQLHNLVITLTVDRLFSSNNPAANQRLKQVWEHSRRVAAVSYVLASRHAHLSPDQALLAGLMHNIGLLPLYLHIENNRLQIDADTLASLGRKTHQSIGAKLLNSWHFPPEVITVVQEHENLHRESGTTPLPDYTDVIMFANLQNSTRAVAIDWGNNISALQRLGIDKEECLTFWAQHAERIEAVEVMLGMKPKPRPVITAAAAQTDTAKISPPAEATKKERPQSFLSRLWG